MSLEGFTEGTHGIKNTKVRSFIIRMGGKVFRILLSGFGNNVSLSQVSRDFMSGLNIIKNDNTSLRDNIETLRTVGKGLIIGIHATGIFTDYLPLFAELGEDILQECIFYTGEYNLAMNKREFPGYNFRGVPDIHDKEAVHEFIKEMEKDIQRITESGGHIFLMPAGGGKDHGQDFKAILRRLIAGLDGGIPVLAYHIKPHSSISSYPKIALRRIASLLGWETKAIDINLITAINYVSEWKGLKTGAEFRRFYNGLFHGKNPPSE